MLPVVEQGDDAGVQALQTAAVVLEKEQKQEHCKNVFKYVCVFDLIVTLDPDKVISGKE